MVFASRRASGAAFSERVSASFWLAIACSVWLPVVIRLARSLRRSAIAPKVLAPETRKRESETESRESSAKSCWDVESAGLRNL